MRRWGLLLLVALALGAAVWVYLGDEALRPATEGSAGQGPEAQPAASGNGPTLEGLEPGKRPRRTRVLAADVPGPAPARGHLAGRVVTPAGEPSAGARVMLYVVGAEGQPHPRTRVSADAQGRFRLLHAGPDAAVLLVTVDAPGHLYGWRRLAVPSGLADVDLGDLALRDASGAITGQVQDGDGRPLVVELAFEREPDAVDEPLFAAAVSSAQSASDPTGAFASPPLPPGSYRIHLLGREAHLREHVPAGTQGLSIVLAGETGHAQRAALVEVRFEGVSDADLAPARPDGLPVLPVFYEGDALLRCQPVVRGSVPSPARGGPGWEGRAVSTWSVFLSPTVSRPLLVRGVRGSRVDPRFGPGLVDVRREGTAEVRLPRAGEVRGRVLSQGRGVAAVVEVRYDLGPQGAEPAGRSLPEGSVRVEETGASDAEGRFALGGLPAGSGAVRARPERRRGGPSVDDALEESPWVPVAFGEGREVVLEVSAPARLTLRLTWPAGEPPPPLRPGVSVTLLEGEGHAALASEATWEEGILRVEVAHLPRTGPVALVVVSGSAWLETEPLLPRAEPYDLALRPAGRIEGRVLLPDGRPASQGVVWAVYLGARELSRTLSTSAELGPDGGFVLRPSAPGRYLLEVEDLPEGVVPPLEVEAGGGPLELRAQLAARLEGRLVGREGEDLSAFYVDAVEAGLPAEHGAGAWCAEDGVFRIAWPGDRPLTLVARAEDPRDERCAVLRVGPGGSQDVSLALRAGARVSGRVLGADGQPVAGALVRLTSALASDEEETDEQGRFAILGLPDDTWTVVVRAAGREVTRRVGPGEHAFTLPR